MPSILKQQVSNLTLGASTQIILVYGLTHQDVQLSHLAGDLPYCLFDL
jgi:hypothetical protein